MDVKSWAGLSKFARLLLVLVKQTKHFPVQDCVGKAITV